MSKERKNIVYENWKYMKAIFWMSMIALLFSTIGSADINRTIDNAIMTAGSDTIVTVTIQNDIAQALSLQETLPSGWNLTRITDNADQFKASTNEWVWLTVTNNTIKTVKYKVTVPSGTLTGVYNIKGSITTNNITTDIVGDNTISVIQTQPYSVVYGTKNMTDPDLKVGTIDTNETVNNNAGSGSSGGSYGSGTWYQGNGGISLTVGQTSIVNMNSLKIVSSAYISAGCNNGETMDGYIEYLNGSNWRIVQYFTGADCGSNISFPQITTNSLRLTMTSGGGNDNKISWYSQGSNGWKIYATDIVHQTLSATRTIDNTPTIACGEKIITVNITNDYIPKALSLKETIPSGWSIIRISDGADQFKASTNEWIWLSLASNAVKTVKYKLTVPCDTKPGAYYINGNITVSNGGMTGVTGSNTISIVSGDILSYYRGLGLDPNIVETGDLLKAADDWRNDIIPPGYSVSINTSQLLILADEWRTGVSVSTPSPTPTPTISCDSSYPDVCIPPYPPDLNCGDIPYKNFKVLPPDPHRFDADKDGIGCET
jgi:hypothetical protein